MSLDYSTKKVADDPSLTDENGYWIPEFQSIVFATMTVGINELKESNVEEFYRRYVNYVFAMGYEPYFNLETLRKFVGLATNASTKTISQFNKDVLAQLQYRTQQTIKKEQGN